MKRILACIVIVAGAIAAEPAPVASVQIASVNTVAIDGQSAGTVVDVLANRPDVSRPAVLDAWLAYENGLKAQAQQLAQQLAAAQAELAAVKADRDALKAKYEPQQTPAPTPAPPAN